MICKVNHQSNLAATRLSRFLGIHCPPPPPPSLPPPLRMLRRVQPVLDAGVFHTRRDLLSKDGQRMIIVRPRFLNWQKFDTYVAALAWTPRSRPYDTCRSLHSGVYCARPHICATSAPPQHRLCVSPLALHEQNGMPCSRALQVSSVLPDLCTRFPSY